MMSNKPSNTANIMILAFLPSYCPNCATEWEGTKKYPQDFWAGASHFCRGCGMRYQYVERDIILRAAQDLRYYWEQENGKLQQDLGNLHEMEQYLKDKCPDCGEPLELEHHKETMKCTDCNWSEPL